MFLKAVSIRVIKPGAFGKGLTLGTKWTALASFYSAEQVDALQQQRVMKIKAGLSHSLCLTEAGEMLSWGENTNGQLGRGDVPMELCRVPK